MSQAQKKTGWWSNFTTPQQSWAACSSYEKQQSRASNSKPEQRLPQKVENNRKQQTEYWRENINKQPLQQTLTQLSKVDNNNNHEQKEQWRENINKQPLQQTLSQLSKVDNNNNYEQKDDKNQQKKQQRKKQERPPQIWENEEKRNHFWGGYNKQEKINKQWREVKIKNEITYSGTKVLNAFFLFKQQSWLVLVKKEEEYNLVIVPIEGKDESFFSAIDKSDSSGTMIKFNRIQRVQTNNNFLNIVLKQQQKKYYLKFKQPSIIDVWKLLLQQILLNCQKNKYLNQKQRDEIDSLCEKKNYEKINQNQSGQSKQNKMKKQSQDQKYQISQPKFNNPQTTSKQQNKKEKEQNQRKSSPHQTAVFNKIEDKNKQKQLERENYYHLFEGDILTGITTEKQFLTSSIQDYTHKQILYSKLIYRFDPLNTTNYHKYIDNHRHICLIVKLRNNRVVAGYSVAPIIEGVAALEGGLILSLTEKRAFRAISNKRSVTYDAFFLIFGNSELRLRQGELSLFSNFGINNGYYNAEGEDYTVLMGKGASREQEIETYEVFEVIFR